MTKRTCKTVLLIGAVTLFFAVWAIVAVLTHEETPEHWDRLASITVDEKTYLVVQFQTQDLPAGFTEFGSVTSDMSDDYPTGSPLYRNEKHPEQLYVLNLDNGLYSHLEDQRLNDKLLYYEGQWYLPDQAQYVPSRRRHEVPSYRKADCTPTGEFTFRTSGIPTTSGAVNVRDWEGGQILLYDPDPRFLFLMVEGTPTKYYPFASADFCGLDYSDLLQS